MTDHPDTLALLGGSGSVVTVGQPEGWHFDSHPRHSKDCETDSWRRVSPPPCSGQGAPMPPGHCDWLPTAPVYGICLYECVTLCMYVCVQQVPTWMG